MSNVSVQESDSLESLAAKVADDFLDRQKRGERPEVEEYTARYPEHAAVIGEVLAALRVVGLSGASRRLVPEALLAGGEPPLGELGELGDFRLVREIGRGGMGVVYEAIQLSLGRRVALKVLPFAATLDPKQLQRFKNEAQAAAQLHHTSIVPVYAVGCERAVHFYAMQFIEGQTLAAVIAELRGNVDGRMTNDERMTNHESRQATPCAPQADAATEVRHSTLGLLSSLGIRDSSFFRAVARLGAQAAEALEHAHQLGVVHRDIKPANLLVDLRANLWITDFGLAHCQSQAGLTMTGDLVGTLRYMSPEQALAQRATIDHRADIYSLGATLYELLTLMPAFAGADRQELLRQIAFEEPRPPRRLNRRVPAELETIVLKAMEKKPADRYATAQELADDVRRYLEDKPIRARRPSRLERARKWVRRHRPLVWSTAIALSVTLAVLAGFAGWIVRDCAAWQAKITTDVEAALDEAQHYQKEGKWPQAQAAAKRAEFLLEEGAAEPALAERVQNVLRELAEKEAEGRLLTNLEQIRHLQAEVNVEEDRFVLERALPEYRRVFMEYGLRADVTPPEEAAALLCRHPPAIHGGLVAALDHWLILARYKKAPEIGWLERVLTAADSDAWRQRVREARARGDGKELAKLARDVDAAAQPPEELFLLDLSLHQRGFREGAVALLRRAREAFPGDFWLNHDLGMALLCCQPPQCEEAIRFLTAAVALRPQSAGARLNLGNAFLDKGRLDEAIETFRQTTELNREYAMPHNNLGVALSRKGQIDQAIAAWRQAIKLKPDFPLALNNLGTALYKKGRFEEALPAWRRYTALKPDDADAQCFLGCALWKAGNLVDAGLAFRKAIDVKPDMIEAHLNLGIVLSEAGRLNDAVVPLRRAIELKPDYPEAHCQLGTVHWKKHRPDEAAAAFREAIDLKPDYALAHYNLGNVLLHTGQLDEAIIACRRAIALKPDYAEAHYDLGLALARKNRLDEALAAYRRAIDLKPDYAEAYCDIGAILWQQSRLDEAAVALRKAIDLKPDYTSAHYNLGNVLVAKSRFDEGIVAYRKAIKLNPDLAEAHCNLGIALRQLGQFAQALAALKRGHKLGSRRPDWPYPSAQWLRECKRLCELDGRLPAILKREAHPIDAAEQNEYAQLCYCKKLYAASARLRAEAFAADPKLADDLESGHRFDAACAAALAAEGKGKDADGLSDAERARWRKQALAWLRADLKANAKLLEGGNPQDRRLVAQRLRRWQRDQDFASLRESDALAKLSVDEQEACKQLWAKVEELLANAYPGE
jgi:tetratricopeptide (TPR) repeat protein